jgi:hypothetical protein
LADRFASTLFGEPRQTVDADVIARLLLPHAERLVQRLAPQFYIELSAVISAIENQHSFNVIHLETVTKVDIFVRWRTPFGQSQFTRRQKKIIGLASPLELFFASPEDTVLAKLDWYRQGGEVSDKQWRDIVGVLKVQGRALDRDYSHDGRKNCTYPTCLIALCKTREFNASTNFFGLLLIAATFHIMRRKFCKPY